MVNGGKRTALLKIEWLFLCLERGTALAVVVQASPLFSAVQKMNERDGFSQPIGFLCLQSPF